MNKSLFDTSNQHNNTSNKIVVGLERISEAFRVLLWQHAKSIGLSPIQIQLLIFISYHDSSLCNVSHLAKEFNLTKATISDAVKTLEKKKYIVKNQDTEDKRAYSISLSKEGAKVVAQTEHFANPIKEQLNKLPKENREQLFYSISQVIYRLNRAGILDVQRTCFGCRFYQKKGTAHYCKLMQKDLVDKDIRLDCEEFEAKS